MPQINRIRVNNVKYNFGTQFYDDFVMRFSCKNAIYDLANGGGKSVLMLLLLQNLIPNCTLDEKQPIEKLFRSDSGSTTIHSLVEWKLDPCYMKDNYKYMTTGFCARKGKEEPDREVTKGTANIEYFNYCIFYREFGDNDIKNLPLSKGKERITYQGLKNYLRELEKKDFGVSVKIFDRKNEYQQFISGYGIFESQWEIVRGINKTEGHVRTYFETNYKTGRKVVEDLLIEQIIEKSFANRIGIDVGEDNMARTLLDIKDKLIELSKKRETLDNYDKQIEALSEFAHKVEALLEMYQKKEDVKAAITSDYLAIKNVLRNIDASMLEYEEKKEKLALAKDEISRDIAISNIVEDEANLLKLKDELKEKEERLQVLVKRQEEYAQQLRLKEAAMHYQSYLESKMKKDEIQATIDNRLRDFEDIKGELNELAGDMQKIYSAKLDELTKSLGKAVAAYEVKSELLTEKNEKSREYDRSIAVNTQLIKDCEAEIEVLIAKLQGHMQEVSVGLMEDMQVIIQNTRNKLHGLTQDKERFERIIREEREKLTQAVANAEGLSIREKLLEEEITRQNEALLMCASNDEKLTKLMSVYGQGNASSLEEKLIDMLKTGIYELSSLEASVARYEHMIAQLKEGVYAFDEPQYREVMEYLTDTYGEDVIAGDKWLHNQSKAIQRDILKRVPFITHSIVIKEDFERIKEDITLKNMSKGAYVVPIVGEGVLYETRVAVNSEHILFAFKDLSFLADEEDTQREISKLEEEIVSLKDKAKRLDDRNSIVRSDYAFVIEYNNNDVRKKEELTLRISELEAQLEDASNKIKLNLENKDVYSERILKYENELKTITDKLVGQEKELDVLHSMVECKEELSKREDKLSQCKKSLSQDTRIWEGIKNDIADIERELLVLADEKTKLGNAEKDYREQWSNIYEPYYVEGVCSAKSLLQEEIAARFIGLKSVIDKEAVDVKDKENLYAAYDNAGKKAISDMEYLGLSLEEAGKLYEQGALSFSDRSELYAIRESKKAADGDIRASEADISSQSAIVNQTEGSIAYAKKQLIEKYGECEIISISNAKLYREEKKNALRSVESDIKALVISEKDTKDQHTKAVIINKDLERIIKNMGIVIAENVTADNKELQSIEDTYEKTVAEYDVLMKEESRRKDEFIKNRQSLKELLEALNAYELATEIGNSLEMPKTSAETKELVENIAETNKCIELEKDRVGKGILDMQRIKDSFENRCIQTCDNIKAELEKLPKLSKITMDNEVISIINLSIPYIKEELKKDRMSSYIQEIITGSESYSDEAERLKYIKNKLTWKKLFSVIVTDMNAIKLNLYKRERIANQSRYLKYEEAVGSTGQSQGIYIQFLIAVINYISNINAAGKSGGAVGNTIFIDNPFGAAKDIYIWEPIFKLLKANHVQLIVPARGTTPAIIGRFDVNYILGQKLVNGAQQTVVVDYRSQTAGEEIEYKRLEYEQETLQLG